MSRMCGGCGGASDQVIVNILAEKLKAAGAGDGLARAIAAGVRDALAADTVTPAMLTGELGKLERRLNDRIAETERRMGTQLWRLFGAMVALAGLAIAAMKLLG